MQEHDLGDKDEGGPFSSRELWLALGGAMVWVTLSAALVLILPVRSL